MGTVVGGVDTWPLASRHNICVLTEVCRDTVFSVAT